MTNQILVATLEDDGSIHIILRDGSGALLRPQVVRFAVEMERKLRARDHRRGWRSMRWADMLARIRGETSELRAQMKRARRDPRKIVEEAADVGNFAMFVADTFGDWSR